MTDSLFDACLTDYSTRYQYCESKRQVERVVLRTSGRTVKTTQKVERIVTADNPCEAFDLAWLRSKRAPLCSQLRGRSIQTADLFCGAGGFALGIAEAARAMGRPVNHVLAADSGVDQRRTFVRNFRPRLFLSEPIEQWLDGRLGERLTPRELQLKRQGQSLDLVTGGPPCQGHSNLNNHTRRNDPKNALYSRMARFAEVFEPESVIIENVPGVQRDQGGVFDSTIERFQRIGYSVSHRLVRMEDLGVPQRRHRVIVIATMRRIGANQTLQSVQGRCSVCPRPVSWAIGDLLSRKPDGAFDVASTPKNVTRKRIDWLFDNHAYDLPNKLRPACHRLKEHTYNAVYGRLYWDQPAWTITTGFQSMGQGRFVHPLERRVLTAHEAARIQFIPDFMEFCFSTRSSLATMIGNAVPPRLAYLIALELLR
jgi:DNA (cytosine-5)-methyltransferase 1